MPVFDGAGGLIVLAVWIFSFVDVIVTPETQCRSLPKLAWVFVVLLLPLVGSIAWLVLGHPWERSTRPMVSTRSFSRWSDADEDLRRGSARMPVRRAAANPDDDDEFLAGLRKRAEEQRRRAQDLNEPDGDKS